MKDDRCIKKLHSLLKVPESCYNGSGSMYASYEESGCNINEGNQNKKRKYRDAHKEGKVVLWWADQSKAKTFLHFVQFTLQYSRTLMAYESELKEMSLRGPKKAYMFGKALVSQKSSLARENAIPVFQDLFPVSPLLWATHLALQETRAISQSATLVSISMFCSTSNVFWKSPPFFMSALGLNVICFVYGHFSADIFRIINIQQSRTGHKYFGVLLSHKVLDSDHPVL